MRNPSADTRPSPGQSRDLTRWWPAVLLLIGLAAVWAARVPLDPQRQQQGQFLERCTTAFSADSFASARHLLGLATLSDESFRIVNTNVRQGPGGQQVVFGARFVTANGELLRGFVCQSQTKRVSFRLARPSEWPWNHSDSAR